jgi:hypothetical protein
MDFPSLVERLADSVTPFALLMGTAISEAQTYGVTECFTRHLQAYFLDGWKTACVAVSFRNFTYL